MEYCSSDARLGAQRLHVALMHRINGPQGKANSYGAAAFPRIMIRHGELYQSVLCYEGSDFVYKPTPTLT